MKKPYFVEPSLPSKVQKYMNDNDYVDVDDMTEYLIKNYREFRTKKKNTFVKSVWKAYKWNLYSNGLEEEISAVEGANSEELFEIDSNGGRRSPEIVEVPSKNYSSSFSIDSMYKSNSTPIRPVMLKKEESSKRKRKKVEVDDVVMGEIVRKKKQKFELTHPDSSLEEMRGIDTLNETACLLSTNLVNDNLKVGAPKCVLISGPQGSGKTTFVSGLAGDLQCALLRIPVSELTSSFGQESENIVKEAFKVAFSNSPCIILLENLEVLGSKEHGYSKGPDRKICDLIISCLRDLESKEESGVIVIGEARNTQNVDMNLRTLFKLEVFMPVLDKVAREDVLKKLCPALPPDFDLKEIALRTSSYVAGDLKDLVQKTRLIAWKRVVKESIGPNAFRSPKDFFSNYQNLSQNQTLTLTLPDFFAALPTITPMLKREGFPMVPDTTWEDVGGLQDIKSELTEKILGPMQYGDLHEKFGAKKPNGIMLWGPPGCGKTLLAKAVANHAGVNLYAVMGPELLNMYQGESERAIREVFKRASSVAPCVIFFDEFDCICPRRSTSSDGGSKMTIVNTLLVEMNGFNQRKDVYVMAATNRPDMVDPAVLRPERFDTSLFVGLPDQKGRIAVLKACTKNATKPKLASDVDLAEIASWCENFSGADCAQLVYMASKSAISEEIERYNTANEVDETQQNGEVGTLFKRHFVAAISRVSSSVGIEEQRKYLRMKAKFESSKREGKQVVLTEDSSVREEEMNKK